MNATAAVQEDVTSSGLDLSGAHMTLFPRVRQLLVIRDARHPGDARQSFRAKDADSLQALGIGRLFGPGNPTSDLVATSGAGATTHLS